MNESNDKQMKTSDTSEGNFKLMKDVLAGKHSPDRKSFIERLRDLIEGKNDDRMHQLPPSE